MTIMVDKLPPGEIRDDYQRLYEALTRVKAKGSEGHVAATLAEMTEDEASELAKLVCGLEAKLTDAVR